MASIRISQLNNFSGIKSEDFIPLIDSSSLTTYRSTVESLGAWMGDSGSAASASFASRSLVSISSSWASSSISSISSSFLVYPNTSTASLSITSSHAITSYTASYAMSSSNANTSSFSNNGLSASYAKSSSNADTASYVNFTVGVPPFASSSLSSSWASQSLSSSYAETASYVSSVNSASLMGILSLVITSSALIPITASGGHNSNYFSHSLGVVPKFSDMWYVCVADDGPWKAGDEFRRSDVHEDSNDSYYTYVWRNSSVLAAPMWSATYVGGITITYSKWRIKYNYSLYN